MDARSRSMRMNLGIGGISLVLAACLVPPGASEGAGVGEGDLAGVVTSAGGPEGGVWVIAETDDLPTKFAKIVVTDHRGRYLMPELPKANYRVWVRGYGLVDSPKVRAAPGKILNLNAVVATSAADAAEYCPAIYWYSMLKVPERNEFPIGKAANQGQWLDLTKTDGCYTCHQLGNKATRTIPKELGHFNPSVEAWARRIASGQAMTNMTNNIGRFDAQRMLGQFADWTDRIAAGELPASRPERPQGLERNVVISLWDWSRPTAYLHDEISSDKRNPTVNAYGLIYGATEESTDFVPVLDPVRHTASEMKVPVRDPKTPSTKNNPMAPSAYWGAEPIWDSQTSPHNPMLDEKGRVWFTSRVRGPANPAFCGKGSDHPSAKVFPVERSNRQLSMYDPKTGKFTLIDTCFGTHHLYFAEDADNTLWASSGGAANEVLGWLNRKVFEETGDEQKAQGWTPFVLDTNGNGRRDDYVGPNDPVDPKRDKRIVAGFYGLAPSPVDGSIWGSVLGYPGFIIRVNPGSNPPETALTEVFEPPFPGYSPSATGNANDALLALKDGKFVILRVPYPMGFYAKGLDGRIDDPGAGWKGRALWSTYATRAPFHVEGGKGTRSKVLKFQLRPDPLAN